MVEWRSDPRWRLILYDPERFDDVKKVPVTPTPQAELAQPPVWASLYEGNRIVATWWRPSAPTEPRATVVAEKSEAK
jgi:hypothetical protein